MKLADKGRYAPPPHLPPHAQAVSTEIASWPGVQARTHWLLGDESQVDGADFYVGEQELGHIHLDGEAHLALEKPLRDALIAARLASPFRWSQGFVVCSIRSAAAASLAQALFRLAYDRLQGESTAALLTRLRGLSQTSAHANA
jgi:Family of unknown function (DUF5519)